MLNKIYLIALAVFVLGMCLLTYIAYDWLGSIDYPETVKLEYEKYAGYGRMFLLISSLVLLILSNVILWKTRQTWAFWSTLAYFCVFILIQNFWLDGAFNQFQIKKNIAEDTFSPNPLIGVLLCIAAAGFVFFNQFFVARIYDKMVTKDAPIKELPDDAENVEEAN